MAAVDLTARRLRVAALCVALVAASLYLNTLPGPFLGDDVVEIQQDERIHSLGNIPSLMVTGFTGAGPSGDYLYRPLTAIASALLWVAGGGGAWIFHSFNIAMHAAASCLALFLLLAFGFSLPAALLAGLLFAAHPLHTEAVAWVSGRAEMTATTFLLLAWLAHLRSRRILAGASFLAAVLCKETAVVFPGLALAGDLLRGRGVGPGLARGARTDWRALALYAGVLAGYLGLRYAALGGLLGGSDRTELRELINPLIGAPAMARVLTSVKVLGVALRQSLFPRVLCIDYSFNQLPVADSLFEGGVLQSLLLFGVVAAVAWIRSDQRRGLALAAVIFLLSFLPASNMLFAGVAIFAERNLYLPLLGVCLAAALFLAPSRWGRALAGIVLVLLSARTVARNREFLGLLELNRAGAASCPDSAWAHHAYGVALRETGDLDRALAEQRRAATIAPRFAGARGELGVALILLGRDAEAESELSEAVRLAPDDWQVRSNLALLYGRNGRLADALREYAEALRLRPEEPGLLGNYAAALIDAGRTREAQAIFEGLTAREPASAVGPNGLGALAAREGRWEEAAALFGEAARREPRNVNAIYNQAQALARTGRLPQAIGVLERAGASGVADDAIVRLLNDLRAASRAPL